MKKNKGHIDLNLNPENKPDGFLQQLEIPYKRTREEVWAELDKNMTDKPNAKFSVFRSHKVIFSIAASILLLAGIFSLLRFYSTTITCPEGKHLSYVLPDGSKIEMNVDTKITYHPLWWRFSRKLEFEGEGYFEVEKGKKFEVVSAIGTTEVLGTTFNIYARENEYKVTCLTGRVKVTSFKSKVAILSPDIEASINSDGTVIVQRNQEAKANSSWVKNMFSFAAKPLGEVFQEIARQYGVKLNLNVGADYLYTGYFSKDRPVEEVLKLVCKPFGLTFTRVSDKEYRIFQN
jgi:transmembrane sensor